MKRLMLLLVAGMFLLGSTALVLADNENESNKTDDIQKLAQEKQQLKEELKNNTQELRQEAREIRNETYGQCMGANVD
jgi:F0F1-type ATP synthase membrane subunit b/b'